MNHVHNSPETIAWLVLFVVIAVLIYFTASLLIDAINKLRVKRNDTKIINFMKGSHRDFS